MSSIHFADNNSVTEETKKIERQWKLCPWISSLRQNFLDVSPDEFNTADEIMFPFKGKSILRHYMSKRPHKWGFKIWGRKGVFGFLCDFDIYQGRSNKKVSSDLGMSSEIVKALCKSHPSEHNFKIFADNFFTSLALADELKKSAMYFVRTVRITRLKNCPLVAEKDLKIQGCGAIDYGVETNSNIIAAKCYENKAPTLISSFVGIDPITEISRYDCSAHEKVVADQPNIVKVYNTFMDGVDKLGMVCSLYKQTICSRRWFAYIWLHSIIITVSNAWILYPRNVQLLDPTQKTMALRVFQGMLADSLVKANKRSCEQPSSISPASMAFKKQRIQGTSTPDIRKDGIYHFPEQENKRQQCMYCDSLSYIKYRKCNVCLCLKKTEIATMFFMEIKNIQ